MRDGEIVSDELGGQMSRFRELVGVALGGLAARKTRTALILLGPMLGVAAIIAAVGLTDSAEGRPQGEGPRARHQPDRGQRGGVVSAATRCCRPTRSTGR